MSTYNRRSRRIRNAHRKMKKPQFHPRLVDKHKSLSRTNRRRDSKSIRVNKQKRTGKSRN